MHSWSQNQNGGQHAEVLDSVACATFTTARRTEGQSDVASREQTQQNIICLFSGIDHPPLPYNERLPPRVGGVLFHHFLPPLPAITLAISEAYGRCGEISVRKHQRLAAPRMLQANLAVAVISRSNFPTFFHFRGDLAVSAVCMLKASFNRARVCRSAKVGPESLW